MKTSIRTLFLCAAIACFFTLTLAAFAEQKATSTPPPATPAPAVTTPATGASESESAAASENPDDEKSDLRRLDKADDDTDTIVTPDEQKPTKQESPKPEKPAKRKRHSHSVSASTGNPNERVNVGSDVYLGPTEKADTVVSVFGSATAEGDVSDSVVSVLGNTRVTGPVGDTAVAVLGNNYVNSHVRGEVVAVLGDVTLGPKAEVDGDVVSVGGTITREPGSIVHGSMHNSFAANFTGIKAWFTQCLMYGRPLAFGPHLMWAWWIALGFLTLYVIIALIFRGGVEKCVDTLEHNPGYTLLAALISILLVPIVLLLLCFTVVGIVIGPLLVFLAALFGKAVVLCWLGGQFIKLFSGGNRGNAALATLLGGLIVLALYVIPVVGLVVYKVIGLVGIGAVLYTLLIAMKREKPAPVAAAAMPASAMVVDVPVTDTNPMATGAMPVPPAATVPPVISAVTLPRAGFWIRTVAGILDVIIVGVAIHLLPSSLHLHMLLGIGLYCLVFWSLKATTIGGIVCGLKVVRLDDRPIDWMTALVRVLGGFLSFVVAFLGFIWVAFDDQKQSWHDKIAGTTIVRVPKGVSLV